MKTPLSHPSAALPEDTANTTAYALQELDTHDRAAFKAKLEADPSLSRELRGTEEFCQLLSEHLQDPVDSLSETARAHITHHALATPHSLTRVSWLRGLTALAASVTVGSTLYWLLGTQPTNPTALVVKEKTPDLVLANTEAKKSIELATPQPVEALVEAQNVYASKGPTSESLPDNTSSARELSVLGDSRRRSEAEHFKNSPFAPASKSRTATPPYSMAPLPSKAKESPLPQPRENDTPSRLPTTESTENESYAHKPANIFQAVKDTPLSTFSIDVDTASYSNVRRFLNRGERPPVASVRLEELVNYFPYQYATPVDGRPFAVAVETTTAPWESQHRIARIAIKGKEVAASERSAANLVFLVDVSGSMNDANKLPLVKQSLRFILEKITERDRVSLVTYAGSSAVVLPSTLGSEKVQILAAIDGLGAEGSTNGSGGITAAYLQAQQHFITGGINRVVLASDGDFNVGVTSADELEKLITTKAKSGVFLSLLGYGMGNLHDDRMEMLANKGNGNYAYIDSLSEARKALSDQFSSTLITIAKDVKIQVEFNPAKVQAYRLLGYENRMLNKEDFTDDKKDAGEIGAGHSVTALYEIVPAGVALPASVEPLKYQRVEAPANATAPPTTPSQELLTVKLRWKAPEATASEAMEVPVVDTAAPLSEANPETRWALAVAGFAELLRDTEKGSLTWDMVRSLALAAKGVDPHGYRGEFIQLIDKARSLTGH